MVLHKSAWKNAPIMNMMRTGDVKQLASRDMRIVEDPSETALPISVDSAEVLVQGPAKFEQLGTDACSAIIDSALQGLDVGQRTVVFLWDLRVKTAHMLTAFLKKRQSFSVPLIYIGLCEDMVEYEWATKEVIKDLVTAMKAGELTIPGFTNIEKEMPQDLLEQPAPPPKMNLLVMGQ